MTLGERLCKPRQRAFHGSIGWLWKHDGCWRQPGHADKAGSNGRMIDTAIFASHVRQGSAGGQRVENGGLESPMTPAAESLEMIGSGADLVIHAVVEFELNLNPIQTFRRLARDIS